MSKNFVIIGAGFKGFCDALQLLNTPGNEVTIIDRDPFFGGMSYSGSFHGFAVDKGVHMFDSIPADLAEIVEEIMDGRVRTVDFISMSAFNGVITDGFSLPDLNSLDQTTKDQITAELKALAARGPATRQPRTLAELFEDRYGKTASGIFGNIFKAVYNIAAEDALPDAISKTSLGRLKHLDDDKMLELKQSNTWLDSVLAARRKAVGKVDDLVSIYPDTGEAMRGWCDRAAKWIERKGATLRLGEQVKAILPSGDKTIVETSQGRYEADHVIWTNDNTKALSNAMGFDFDAGRLISGTPMLFATLVTQARHIRNFTYLQNFDPDGITYRTASAGIYSGQTDDEGASFVTCECPAAMDSERWINAPQMHTPIWEECKKLGIVSNDAELIAHSVVRAPVTFKVEKLGYDTLIAEFNEEVKKRNPRVVFRDVKPFFRRHIYLDSLNLQSMFA